MQISRDIPARMHMPSALPGLLLETLFLEELKALSSAELYGCALPVYASVSSLCECTAGLHLVEYDDRERKWHDLREEYQNDRLVWLTNTQRLQVMSLQELRSLCIPMPICS